MMYRYSSPYLYAIFGIIWCVAIVIRWREDVETLRVSKDLIEKLVIWGYWFVTAIIAIAILKPLVPTVRGVLSWW